MRKSFFSLFICALCGVTVNAQPLSSNTMEQKLAAAQLAEIQQNYAGALEWYRKMYDDERTKETALKIAELSYYLRDYDDAESYLKRVLRRDRDNEYWKNRFLYGKVHKEMGNYDLALEEFRLYLELEENDSMITETKFELAGIELLKGIDENIETQVKPLSTKVNSASGEFSPVRYNDGSLYYASFNRKDEIEVDKSDDEFHMKIHMAQKGDKDFSKGEALDQKINRKGFHSSTVSFSPDGRVMYFTRVQTEGTLVTTSRIMISYLKDSGWSAPVEAVDLNGDWNSKHPVHGQLFGNDVLFFVSDMEGGEGGFDIFYATIRGDGSFATPVNLGPAINTPRDEMTPYYLDGTLYFSSNGYPTIGGFDIFYSTWDGTKWSPVENMGMGYNSSYDDIYLSFNEDGKSGYFTSNRDYDGKKRLRSKTCCDDIFEFQIRDIVIDLLATVVDSAGPLAGATIKLTDNTAPEDFPPVTKTNALGHTFQFLLESDHSYKAVVTKEGYYPDSVSFNTAGILDSYTVRRTIELKPKPTFTTEIVTINQPIRLNNIYYDFDDYKILPDAEKDLQLLLDLMNEYDDMVIELSSHTDSRGISRYNESLSQRRAQSATDWLLERGVAEERIKAVGYGEKQILNRCVDGVRCSEEEHQLNRRTEFKIIAGPQSIEIRREITTPVGNDQ